MSTPTEDIRAAFDQLGGLSALVEWGKIEPAKFYSLWARVAESETTQETGLADALTAALRRVEKV